MKTSHSSASPSRGARKPPSYLRIALIALFVLLILLYVREMTRDQQDLAATPGQEKSLARQSTPVTKQPVPATAQQEEGAPVSPRAMMTPDLPMSHFRPYAPRPTRPVPDSEDNAIAPAPQTSPSAPERMPGQKMHPLAPQPPGAYRGHHRGHYPMPLQQYYPRHPQQYPMPPQQYPPRYPQHYYPMPPQQYPMPPQQYYPRHPQQYPIPPQQHYPMPPQSYYPRHPQQYPMPPQQYPPRYPQHYYPRYPQQYPPRYPQYHYPMPPQNYQPGYLQHHYPMPPRPWSPPQFYYGQ